LQGWAAKLLLLWVGIFHFFSFQICNHVTAVSFFRLAYNELLDAKAYEFVRIRIARGQCPKRVTAMRV
jgi:hypothetical protein